MPPVLGLWLSIVWRLRKVHKVFICSTCIADYLLYRNTVNLVVYFATNSDHSKWSAIEMTLRYTTFKAHYIRFNKLRSMYVDIKNPIKFATALGDATGLSTSTTHCLAP